MLLVVSEVQFFRHMAGGVVPIEQWYGLQVHVFLAHSAAS